MTELICQKCEYVWDYTGSLATATCPSCKGTVPVDEQRVGSAES